MSFNLCFVAALTQSFNATLLKRLARGTGEVAQRFLEEYLERFNCVVTIRVNKEYLIKCEFFYLPPSIERLTFSSKGKVILLRFVYFCNYDKETFCYLLLRILLDCTDFCKPDGFSVCTYPFWYFIRA